MQFANSFQMEEDHIESSLSECSGRGWSASVVGKNWVCYLPCCVPQPHCVVSVSIACFSMGSYITSIKVGLRDIEYKKEYKGDELELRYAVKRHLYPPAISLHILQSEVPRHLQSHKRILLHVRGTKKGAMNFPFYVFEEKEGVS